MTIACGPCRDACCRPQPSIARPRARPSTLLVPPSHASLPPLLQSFAEKLAKLQAAEGMPTDAAEFSLNFLWLDKNIAVAVDQVFHQVRRRCGADVALLRWLGLGVGWLAGCRAGERGEGSSWGSQGGGAAARESGRGRGPRS